MFVCMKFEYVYAIDTYLKENENHEQIERDNEIKRSPNGGVLLPYVGLHLITRVVKEEREYVRISFPSYSVNVRRIKPQVEKRKD